MFSVLIANYNNGRYLQQAIDSVIAQSYDNWEIVIVDDGSTDESETIYRKYNREDRVRVVYNGTNKGCGYTKWRCVENARGTFCGFLDPDDALLPNALEVMVGQHQRHPEASVIFSRHYVCDENLKIIRESRMLKIKEGESYFTNLDYKQESFSSFVKEMYDKTEGISPSLHKAVDQDLYFKLDEVGKSVAIDAITYKFRICKTGISHENHGIPAAFWNMVVRYEACKRRGLDPKDYVLPLFMNYSRHWYKEGQIKTQESASYRLGRFLLKPVKLIKRILS